MGINPGLLIALIIVISSASLAGGALLVWCSCSRFFAGATVVVKAFAIVIISDSATEHHPRRHPGRSLTVQRLRIIDLVVFCRSYHAGDQATGLIAEKEENVQAVNRRGVIVLALLPLVLQTPYWRGILVLCAMNVLLALSLNLVMGYTGQLNLGQSAFFAIGAYVSTILIKSHGWNFWLAGLVAVLAAGVLGLALAAFAARLRGHYLAIASLGFAVITYQVLLNWEDVTQGVRGIYGILPPVWRARSRSLSGRSPSRSTSSSTTWCSPIGGTLRAIGKTKSPRLAGINAARWKAFALAPGRSRGSPGCLSRFRRHAGSGAFNIVDHHVGDGDRRRRKIS
jgi:branched-subunit amino acid ABC-type transport system permease component